MDPEEDVAAAPSEIHIGADLSALSIDELEQRIKLFESEIGRLKDEIAKKRQKLADAESVFRS